MFLQLVGRKIMDPAFLESNMFNTEISALDKNGFIYILSHKSGTTVKVGETKVSPEARERDYIKTYNLKGWKLTNTFKVPMEERKNIEKASHSILQEHQLSGLDGAREIFSCTTEIAINAINTAISRNETARIQQRKEKIARANAKKKKRESKLLSKHGKQVMTTKSHKTKLTTHY